MTLDLDAGFEQLRNGGTFYDLLAFLCFSLSLQSTDLQREVYTRFKKDYRKIGMDRDRRFAALSARGKGKPVQYDELPDELIEQLEALFRGDEQMTEDDWVMVLAAALAVDELMELDVNLKRFMSGMDGDIFAAARPRGEPIGVSRYFYAFEALNPLTKDTFGEVLPKIPCAWSKDSDRNMATTGGCPLGLLRQYLWASPQSEWQTTHLLMKPYLTDKGTTSRDRPAKIVSSPIGYRAPFLMTENENKKEFYIDYIEDAQAEVEARVKATIDLGLEEEAAAVMFPEMMSSHASVERCAEYAEEQNGANSVQLFLLPSSEYLRDGHWINELLILDGDGCCVFCYHKQHPFEYDNKEKTPRQSYFEPIQSDGRLCVLHIPRLGRVGVMICSDVFKTGYLDRLVKEYQIDLLLHVAYSQGSDLLARKLSVTKEESCDVVLCNACAAWDRANRPLEQRELPVPPKDALLTVYFPNGHKQYRKKRGACKGLEHCEGCAFIIELPQMYGGQVMNLQRRSLKS